MNIQDNWEKALKNTEIIRPRVKGLSTYAETNLPYIFLAESPVFKGNTVVRRGEVLVEKPSIVLLSNSPQFEGFEFDEGNNFDENIFMNFLLVRGVKFPSLRYNNKTYSVDVYEDKLNSAVKHHLDKLEKEEDVHTGLIAGPAECWQFSVLIFICQAVLKSSDEDIKKLFENFKDKGKLS